MASKEIEKELGRILHKVRTYQQSGRIEELTYMVGAGMQALEMLGCPIREIRLQSEKIVDSWANSDKAPARS